MGDSFLQAATARSGDGPDWVPPPPPRVDTAAMIKESLEKEIEKPDQDLRQYRYLRLHNNLQVMLVSDPTADHAAAAMDVGVGSASDPEALPGLAHFLEHMLFLGTEKYPSEDAYQSYLEQHGGSSNAYTSHESTTYYFDVQYPHLAGALDRFAQFFKAPLFTESATEREVNAVDSENSKNLQSDPWRLQQLHKWAADPRHPWSKFNVGSLETLSDQEGVNVRQALIAFHAEHYSANRMCVCVLGRESLDALEQLVLPHFAPVVDKGCPPPAFAHPPFPDERLRRYFKVVPVRDFNSLTVTWPLPPIRADYLTKPFRYLSHILGHESAGSLLSLLKSKGWGDQLVAGETRSYSDFATFEISVELTEAGNANVEEILAHIFEAIALLTSEAPQPWVHEEMRNIAEFSFRFKDTVDPQSCVVAMCAAVNTFPARHAMSAPYLFSDFDAPAVSRLLALLTPQRSTVVHVSRAHELVATEKEPWYGTSFVAEPISAELLARWEGVALNGAIAFPEPNPFIPTDFALACDAAAAAAAPAPPPLACTFKEGPLGIGVKQDKASPAVYVYVVSEGSQGAKAGVEVGDAITSIGGASTLGCSRDTVMTMIMQSERPCEVTFAKGAKPAAPARPAAAAKAKAAASAAGGPAPAAPAADGPSAPLPSLPTLPMLLREDGLAALWHKTDATFRRPKTNLYIDIVAPAAYYAPQSACLARLLFKLLEDELTEFSYPAECAGLSHALYSSSHGLRLVLAGYNHKLPTLLERVLKKLAAPALAAERFVVQRELQLKEYANFFRGQPFSYARYAASHLLELSRWHILEYCDFIGDHARCSHRALESFAREQLLGQIHMVVLSHGNTSAAEALALVEAAAGALGASALSPSQLPSPRVLQLPAGAEVHLRSHASLCSARELALMNGDEKNSAVELTLQACIDERPGSMIVELLAQVLQHPAYERLRTVEQLGYIVQLGMRMELGVLGLRVIVQSESAPHHLDDRIEAYLATVPDFLRQLPAADFANHREALIKAKEEAPKTLRAESSTYWNEISAGTYDFERDADDVASLKTLTVDDLLVFWGSTFAAGAPHRRKLLAAVYAAHLPLPPQSEPAATRVHSAPVVYVDGVDEAIAFKRTLSAYPAPRRVDRRQR